MQHLYTLLCFILPVFLIKAESPYHLAKSSSIVSLQIRNKLILVEGEVNGQSGYFLFDTGASELILHEAYFPAGQKGGKKVYFADINGNSAPHDYAYIEVFDWGGLQRRDFLAPRLNLHGLEERLGEKLLGIIGYDVLQHIDLELDYYQKTITLMRPGQQSASSLQLPQPDYSFDFQMDRHLLVLNARLGDAGGLKLALDSGSSVNVCAQRLRPRLKSKALQKRTIGMQGAAGVLQRSPYFIMESLQVESTYSISFCRVVLGKLGAFDDHGFHIDGLLGVNFFRLGKVFLSYSSKQIAVWLGQNDYTLRHSTLGHK